MEVAKDEWEEKLAAAAVVFLLPRGAGSPAQEVLRLGLSALVGPPVVEAGVLLHHPHSCISCLSIDHVLLASLLSSPFFPPSLAFVPPFPQVSFSFLSSLAQELRSHPTSQLRFHHLSMLCGHGKRPCARVYSQIESV